MLNKVRKGIKSREDVLIFAQSVKMLLVDTEGEAEIKVATSMFSADKKENTACEEKECGNGKCANKSKDKKPQK